MKMTRTYLAMIRTRSAFFCVCPIQSNRNAVVFFYFLITYYKRSQQNVAPTVHVMIFQHANAAAAVATAAART